MITFQAGSLLDLKNENFQTKIGIVSEMINQFGIDLVLISKKYS